MRRREKSLVAGCAEICEGFSFVRVVGYWVLELWTRRRISRAQQVGYNAVVVALGGWLCASSFGTNYYVMLSLPEKSCYVNLFVLEEKT